MRMLKTFFNEMMTQSNTAFSLGILTKKDIVSSYLTISFCHLLIVFRGRRTLNNLIAFNLWPVEVLLKIQRSNNFFRWHFTGSFTWLNVSINLNCLKCVLKKHFQSHATGLVNSGIKSALSSLGGVKTFMLNVLIFCLLFCWKSWIKSERIICLSQLNKMHILHIFTLQIRVLLDKCISYCLPLNMKMIIRLLKFINSILFF